MDERSIENNANQSYKKSSTSINLNMNVSEKTKTKTYNDWIFFLKYCIEENSNKMNTKSAIIWCKEKVFNES